MDGSVWNLFGIGLSGGVFLYEILSHVTRMAHIKCTAVVYEKIIEDEKI